MAVCLAFGRRACTKQPRINVAVSLYNNTPKDSIVNLYWLMVDVAAIRLDLRAVLMLLDGKVVALEFWENSFNFVE